MRNKYYRLPAISQAYIKNQDYFLLFETSLYNEHNFQSYIFVHPIKVIRINKVREVEMAFRQIQRYAKKYYLVGYFSYELGYCFEEIFSRMTLGRYTYPLIHLGVFDQAICFNHKTNQFNRNLPGLLNDSVGKEDFSIKNLRFNYSKSEYIRKIKRIQEYIKMGDTYQVNFTAKYLFDFSGSAFALYEDLKNRQSVCYSAFCKFKDDSVISLSPELYFKREGSNIYSRPMKGTVSRGKNIQEDKEMVSGLRKSKKDLSENIMIVDLIRNDLGRISQTGSVRVNRLFDIEQYSTLFQMTSSLSSTLKKGITYFEIFRHIFPGGSVTGAPKIRTMQIIRELERGYRNIYCGALGIIFPRNRAVFNMPIRTISLAKDKGQMGVGSGVVCDSDPEKEYQECILKAKFLTQRFNTFELIETMLWRGRYIFLNEHLKRMGDSAGYFAFYFNLRRIKRQLKDLEYDFTKENSYKIRLLLDKKGNLKSEYSRICEENTGGDRFISFSKYRTDPNDIFLYHKTTNRQLYNAEYQSYSQRGYYEVIFLNNRGEVTEGSFSNIIVRINKNYYTPAVSSGLLAGIYRAYFIKKHNAQERVIFADDLRKVDKIFICNSVRGLVEAKLE
jgi:para-aminobenzoate synthetase/4-amino-4-deoxychorismate lyase